MDYKKLFKDKANGNVCNHMTIVMDNDDGYWKCEDFSLSEEEREKKEEEYEQKYGCPDGYGDVVNILCAVGMNAEWC